MLKIGSWPGIQALTYFKCFEKVGQGSFIFILIQLVVQFTSQPQEPGAGKIVLEFCCQFQAFYCSLNAFLGGVIVVIELHQRNIRIQLYGHILSVNDNSLQAVDAAVLRIAPC